MPQNLHILTQKLILVNEYADGHVASPEFEDFDSRIRQTVHCVHAASFILQSCQDMDGKYEQTLAGLSHCSVELDSTS